ncbi:uncharacterized protein LOC106641445 isoform X2 [Copidosoma floridanum]|uniref:uncharacterized protein LOC106641445 isoform X2 n=1 Tax=Copidosoma floridanum TaxID=29053 RepID=UPI000C6F680C|nr:uncharacterized protein LOC106641445 isoform X2 [Copidosoma floridanum]
MEGDKRSCSTGAVLVIMKRRTRARLQREISSKRRRGKNTAYTHAQSHADDQRNVDFRAMNSLSKSLLLSTLLLLLLLRHDVEALRVEVKVPPYLKKGESARLECRYELGSDKLYSVSWYKDNVHIYKFLKKQQEKLVFNVNGVTIDPHKSSDQLLQLQSVIIDATGYYMCEVNTDSPVFKVVKAMAYMEVIDPPREGPKITGEEEIYASGDIMALNCTSAFSYPTARLQWFINEIEVPPASEVLHSTYHGLHSTRSSLRLELKPRHLTHDRIKITCVQMVRSSPQATIPFVDVRETQIFVQGQASSLSRPSAVLFVLMLLSVLLCKD